MLLLLQLCCFFDQGSIDRALVEIHKYYATTLNTNQKSNIEGQQYYGDFTRFFKKEVYSSLRADIIVGDTPAETLYISGYFYNAGNIIVINDGVLRLNNAHFNLDGNIYLLNKGKMLVDISTLKFLQDYIYQYGILLGDSVELVFANSTTSYNGFPFSLSVNDHAQVIIQNVVNNDWTTAVVSGNANVLINHAGITGEWLFTDACFARFNSVDNFLSWYFFPESSVVSIKFPDGSNVNGFYLDSTLNNINGIDYHVEIDSSTNCMWAAIPLKGSNVSIDSSLLRVTGLLFGGNDSLLVSGLVNGLYYEDYVLPISDRYYHLTNTTVQTWNLYPFDTISLELFSSIFGELCAYGNSYVYLHNAYCDGSGGHLESSDNAFLLTTLSSISADIISKGRSTCIIGYCAQPLGNIWVTGASIMLIVNSIFPLEPVPSDTALVFVAGIDGPTNGSVDDTIAILGSAWVDKGPYQPLDFGYYQVFYQVLGDTAWIPVSDSFVSEVRRDTLCNWNTYGLNPDVYVLRLVLKDNAGDSIDCLKAINLYESYTSEKSEFAVFCFRVFPNPFDDFIVVEQKHDRAITRDLCCSIFDNTGRVVFKRMIGDKAVINTKTLARGVYFVCIDSGNQKIFRKIIKVK